MGLAVELRSCWDGFLMIISVEERRCQPHGGKNLVEAGD
jgi:hypothetical protein